MRETDGCSEEATCDGCNYGTGRGASCLLRTAIRLPRLVKFPPRANNRKREKSFTRLNLLTNSRNAGGGRGVRIVNYLAVPGESTNVGIWPRRGQKGLREGVVTPKNSGSWKPFHIQKPKFLSKGCRRSPRLVEKEKDSEVSMKSFPIPFLLIIYSQCHSHPIL